MYFPKRLELSFRIVLAFPKADGQGTEIVSELFQLMNTESVFYALLFCCFFFTRCVPNDSADKH